MVVQNKIPTYKFVLIQELIRATKHVMYANEYSAYRRNENISSSLQQYESRFLDFIKKLKMNTPSKASIIGLVTMFWRNFFKVDISCF